MSTHRASDTANAFSFPSCRELGACKPTRVSVRVTIALPSPDADECAHSARLVAHIRDEIATSGPIPFARFMERCLYAPGLGYYSAGRTKFGPSGDFVTAPELGTLFAETLAGAIAPLIAGSPAQAAVELGGGSGAFAEAALRALAEHNALPSRYRILEPSADLRERQRARLAETLPAGTFARIDWIDGPPDAPWQGFLFANEVIDALPTTRFVIRAGEVYEEYIGIDANAGFERIDRPADMLVAGAVRHIERELGAPFAEGYRSEILPQLPYWIQAVLGSLERGMALFVDYGYARQDYYAPERSDGTLVCHYRHRAHADPLMLPGLQDITAFVDFTALAEAGDSAGFEIAGYAEQGAFLLGSGLDAHFTDALARADTATTYRLAQQVKRLTLPGEMGQKFKLMLMSRNVTASLLPAAFAAFDQRARL